MAQILLENIQIYAYHGHLPEENKIGSYYRVDLKVEAPIEKAGKTDALEDTINYAILSQIIHEEMAIVSKLLEHVAQRVLDRMGREFPTLHHAQIKIAKQAPPMPGQVGSASVVFEQRF